MLDFAVRLGLVRAVLHLVNVGGAHGEGRKNAVELRASDEDFRCFRQAYQPHLRAAWRIDAFRLAVPDVHAALADGGEFLAADFDVHRAGGGDDAGFVAGNGIFKRLAAREFDDVEIVERHALVVDADDGLVLIVKGRDVHGQLSCA